MTSEAAWWRHLEFDPIIGAHAEAGSQKIVHFTAKPITFSFETTKRPECDEKGV